MKLIIISSPTAVPKEHEIINSLFEKGLEMFQVHKPFFSKEKIQNYIRQFPEKYHNKIFLHSQFLKFHSLKELEAYKQKYEYAFLSPIFDSISKIDYKSKFDLQEVKAKIKGRNIIALGGVDESKIEICLNLGFAGVAVLGAIWQNKKPIEKFLKLKSICSSERSEEHIDASLRSS